MLELNFEPFPVLITNRLFLRQMLRQDAEDLFVLRSDPRVMKYIDRPMARSIDDTLELVKKNEDALAKNEGVNWAITLKENSRLIGTIGFWRIMPEQHRAEIGYAMMPEYHGKGIMQEALSAVLNYGFNAMQIHSVEANINPANEASKKFLEKNKFIQEAYFRENFYYNGQFLDSAIFSLLAPV